MASARAQLLGLVKALPPGERERWRPRIEGLTDNQCNQLLAALVQLASADGPADSTAPSTSAKPALTGIAPDAGAIWRRMK